MAQHVITANRLRDGVVVWRDRDGSWVEPLAAAAIFEADSLEAALADALGDVGRQLVVGVYKVAVSPGEHGPMPGNVRETIRAAGPSVRRDLGIQATDGAT